MVTKWYKVNHTTAFLWVQVIPAACSSDLCSSPERQPCSLGGDCLLPLKQAAEGNTPLPQFVAQTSKYSTVKTNYSPNSSCE